MDAAAPRVPDEDQARMLRARAGDAAAFEELYERWSRPILRFFFHVAYDRDAAEDLCQETFLRVWRAAPRYEVRARFSTYLFQVAKNLWINEREKALRRPRRVSLDACDDPGEGVPLRDAIPGDSPDPAEEAARAETGRRLRAAIDSLSEKLRPVFVLGAVEGMPYDEVAGVLEIPVGTVKSRMWAAVRALRERLGDPP